MILFAFYLFINNPRVYTFSPKDKSGKTIFILGSVHGNEPSGTKACYKLIEYLNTNPPKDNVIIMPMPNLLGQYFNSRYQLKPFNSDINRNFSDKGKDLYQNNFRICQKSRFNCRFTRYDLILI